MTPLRIILFGLLLLLSGLKPVIGGDSLGGGDGGIIILPSAVTLRSLSTQEAPRETVKISSTEDLILMLPANMGDSIAILSMPDEETTTVLILRHGRLYLSGKDLGAIRASGVKSFVITIISADGMALRIVYRFGANNTATLIIY